MPGAIHRRTRAVIAVYIACFAIGACNHARDFAARGWRPYDFAPWPLEAFWSALILLDTLAIVLLLRWRRAGLLLAAAIMLADVGVNAYALLALGWHEIAVAMALQALFLGFVLGSLPFALPQRSVSR
jgi:hypothetical protein